MEKVSLFSNTEASDICGGVIFCVMVTIGVRICVIVVVLMLLH